MAVFAMWFSPRIGLLLFIVIPTSGVAAAADLTRPQPLDPPIAPASSEAAETIGGIRIPDGWRIELFAAEPEVANVVAFDIDGRGRVFACETYRQSRGVTDNRSHDEAWLLADLASETVQDRIDYHKRLLGESAVTFTQHDDRIRRLVDTDGDGQADVSTVFANGFNGIEEGTGAGVLAIGQDVYYTNIPKLWKLTDADDDGVSESRIALSDGYGVRVAFRGHDLHGLIRGSDGRLYFSIGDRGYHVTTPKGDVLANPALGAVFRCELDGSRLEVVATGLRNPQELAQNDVGDWFTVDNNSDSGDRARVVQLLRGGDSGWRMHYQYLADRGPFNRQRLWEPLHDEQPAHIVPPIVNLTDGPSGLAHYPGTGFGDQLKDNFLICDFRGGPSNSGIRSFRLEPRGAFYELAEDAQPIWSVLATDLAFGPGGDLFVSDWVDGWNGLGKGRLYRVFDPQQQRQPIVDEVRKLLSADWTARESAKLIGDLRHVDRRVRLQAQWELARRGEVTALLKTANNRSLSSVSRLHGIWGAEHAARLQPELRPDAIAAMRPLLSEADPIVRAAACQLLADQNDSDAISLIAPLINDSAARVRYAAAMSVADLLSPSHLAAHATSLPSIVADVFPRVTQMVVDNANADPALRHAAIRLLSQPPMLDLAAGLKSHGDLNVRRVAVAALRARLDGRVAEFLEDEASMVVSEASLAIYDAPIPVAMDELAALINRADLPLADEDQLVRRIIASNYRIGGTTAAASLADFAASDRAPAWARVEALDCLLNWATPDSRDRVTNEVRPIANRAASVGRESLGKRIEELMIAPETVREKAIDVASQLGISKIAPQLIERISQAKLRPAARGAALTALARLDAPSAIRIAKLINASEPALLQAAAIDVLGQLDAVSSLPFLLGAASSDNAMLRAKGWDWLARLDDPQSAQLIAEAVEAYVQGNLPADVHLNVIEAAQKRAPEAVRQKIVGYQTKLAETEPLAKYLPSLYGGDPENGKALFMGKTELSCVRCHQVDRAGGEVGPNLTVIGKTRDRRSLLESIVAPDAKISEGFETTVIANEDGQVFTGIVASESDEAVEIIAADGSRQKIDQDEIIARKKGKSSMPAGLAELITPRELRDLVAYLADLQVDPRAVTDTE